MEALVAVSIARQMVVGVFNLVGSTVHGSSTNTRHQHRVGVSMNGVTTMGSWANSGQVATVSVHRPAGGLWFGIMEIR